MTAEWVPGDPLPRRPYAVRWYACGYRDGYTGVRRGVSYFSDACQRELVAYADGLAAGERQARQRERHKQLILLSELNPSC